MSEQITIEKSLRDWWSRVKAGQVGALPAILGLLVLCIVFGSLSSVFLTPGNFANLLTQAAAVTVIAMGLVFVLLLGEIDLSAGYAAGVCGAILVIMVTEMDFAWYIAFPVSILGLYVFSVGILVDSDVFFCWKSCVLSYMFISEFFNTSLSFRLQSPG